MQKKKTLVVLAAGMSSRYESLKQIEGFGIHGETIMEFAIYDAIQAGFTKVIFIIRHDFENNFKRSLASKFENKIEIAYAFQSLTKFTEGHAIPPTRTKPWGTAHALLCCHGMINEPFAVINADDFYGKDAFIKCASFLDNEITDKRCALVAYEIQNTLSDNGTVSRGQCEIDKEGHLVSLTERTKIFKDKDNVIKYQDEDGLHTMPSNTFVSMNFFAFLPSMIELCKMLFEPYLVANINSLKGEFFIPYVVDEFVRHYNGDVKIIHTAARWFGVTYKEDAPPVKQAIRNLIDNKEYPSALWA